MFTKTATALAIIVTGVSGALAATKTQTVHHAATVHAATVHSATVQSANVVYSWDGKIIGSDPSWYVRMRMFNDSY